MRLLNNLPTHIALPAADHRQDPDGTPSARSIAGLNWLNLLVALMQAGFGAFLSVFLAGAGWGTADIGLVLSIGTIAAMAAQIPGGMLVDATPSKRHAAGVAIVLVALAALAVALWPSWHPVLLASMVQGAASCVLGPAIAAITLALTQTSGLGERLGHNVRFGALGSVAAALVMGVVGTWYSQRATLLLAAAAGAAALLALAAIRRDDLWDAGTRTAHRGAAPKPIRGAEDPGLSVACDRCLLVFALCIFLFALGNAALLPIAAGAIARTGWHGTALVVAGSIVVPQLLAAWLSPHIGRLAELHGRRIMLLAGIGAMVLRAVLLAGDGGPWLMIAFQALDGISAASLGVLIPLVVADITHHRGRFNLAMGVVGLASGLGATLSTTLAGAIAERYGEPVAFLALALPGLIGCAVAWRAFPETRDRVAAPAPG